MSALHTSVILSVFGDAVASKFRILQDARLVLRMVPASIIEVPSS